MEFNFWESRSIDRGLAKILMDPQFEVLWLTVAIEDVQRRLSGKLRAFLNRFHRSGSGEMKKQEGR